MAEGGEALAREMINREEGGADNENLVENFISIVVQSENPMDGESESSVSGEDENFRPMFNFTKMTFEMITSRFNDLMDQFDSEDFDEKFKKLVEERENICGWLQALKSTYACCVQVSSEEDELMKKEIEREEAVVEEMLETLMSCWTVQKDLMEPLTKDLDELLFYAPLTGE